MRSTLLLLTLVTVFLVAFPQNKRPIAPIDVYRLQNIADPHISPDGNWIVYVLSTVDTSRDRRNNDLWMISWDGSQQVQLTNGPENERSPRFSPDGKYISF